MLGPRGFLRCAALFLLAFRCPGGQGQVAQEIVALSQLKSLAGDPSARDLPVRLNGVVLCYDPGWHQLYIHDGHETGYFNPRDFQTEPEIGQRVEITGTTVRSNMLANLKMAVLGPGPLPAAK